MNYQTISLIVFWCERRDLLCSRSNGDIFTCECLYNKRCFAPEKRGHRCINFWWFLDLFMPEEQLTVDFLFLPKIGRVKEITVFPRITTGGDYYNFRTKRERCLREGDNFKQCSLNWIFCFIIPLNQKRSLQIYWTWAFKCSKFGSLINFQCQYPLSPASEIESSLISFAESDSTSAWHGGDKRKRRWPAEGWGGEGDYSRESIILNISI